MAWFLPTSVCRWRADAQLLLSSALYDLQRYMWHARMTCIAWYSLTDHSWTAVRKASISRVRTDLGIDSRLHLTYCDSVSVYFCRSAPVHRCQRFGYCSRETQALTELFDEADESLFSSILVNGNHVLQTYLPEQTLSQYNLRRRTHTKKLLNKTTELDHWDFFIRMLYRLLLSPLIEHCPYIFVRNRLRLSVLSDELYVTTT